MELGMSGKELSFSASITDPFTAGITVEPHFNRLSLAYAHFVSTRSLGANYADEQNQVEQSTDEHDAEQ